MDLRLPEGRRIMTLTVIPNLIQGSDAWLEARRGIITASVAGQLITTRKLTAIDYDCPACGSTPNNPCAGRNGPIKTLHTERAAAAREAPITVVEPASNPELRSLTMVLVAERITGWTDENFVGEDMLRGIDDEAIARDIYAAHHQPVTQTGLMIEDKWGHRIGYSPDGVVGDDGLIEIKSRRPKLHLAAILAGSPPSDTMAQMQCALLVSGRAWIDYVSYSSGMPLWTKRIYPQQDWFDAITQSVATFETNATEMIAAYKAATIGLPLTERITYNDDLELSL